MFGRIFVVALVAGVLAGFIGSGVQFGLATPLIVEAEKYEEAAEKKKAEAPAVHSHAPGSAAHSHDHGSGEWEPGSPLERAFWTMVANVLLAVGGALVIAAAFALRKTAVTWKTGLAWGAGAFLAIGLAPALGLPSELPGTAAAELVNRQGWWLGTVVATVGGLMLLGYGKGGPWKALGAVLLVVPHVIGAPHPATPESLAPAALQNQFIVAALISSAIFWIALGGLVGFFANRFGLDRPASAA